MSELTHLASLFNREIHENMMSILPEFPWELQVAADLSAEYKHKFPELSQPFLRSILGGKLVQSELDIFLGLVEDFQAIDSKVEINDICENIFNYYKVRRSHAIISENMEDVPRMLKKLREIPEVLSSKLKPEQLGSMDPVKVREEDIGGEFGVLPTNFKLIRDATPYKGYLRGQVVQWVAAPGIGKSAAMLYEAIGMAVAGYKVAWFALGDLMRYDFISRFTAALTTTPFFDVAIKPEKYFTEEVREIANNFFLSCKPSKTTSAPEILEYLNNCGAQYDLVVIDYDSNLQVESDNMYEAGGEVYDVATQMARPEDGQPARLIFVASQPKIQYWDAEELPEESAGESARKQHIIDMMITMGRGKSTHQCGIMAIPKCRRGTPNSKTPWKMTNCGHIVEISTADYAMMKTYGSK